jgi:hypothetical protein
MRSPRARRWTPVRPDGARLSGAGLRLGGAKQAGAALVQPIEPT